MKEIKDDTNRWKDIPSSWIGRINIVKMTIPPKDICRFNAVPIKLFTKDIRYRTRTEYFKICMEKQKTPNSQSNIEKKSGNQGITLPDFRQYYKVTVIKQYGNGKKQNKHRRIDQWNRIESPEVNQITCGQLIYDKKCKNIQWRKDSFFKKGYGENWKATCKRMKLEHSLTLYTKINLKWIKELNIRPDTIKILEKNVSRMLFDLNHSKILFDQPPRIMTIKTKINP